MVRPVAAAGVGNGHDPNYAKSRARHSTSGGFGLNLTTHHSTPCRVKRLASIICDDYVSCALLRWRVTLCAWPDGRVGKWLPLFAEESPGSMGRLPGNAWALQPRLRGCGDGQCHRKDTADVVKRFTAGKGEMVE